MYIDVTDSDRKKINPQSDWQQNDETANNYIKNRPGGYIDNNNAIVKIPEKYLDIKNTNIVNGSAEGSIRSINSKALGSNTASIGTENIAGGYGYNYRAIDLVNKKIYLTAIKVTDASSIAFGEGAYYSESLDTGYAVGDKFSLVNDFHFDLCGTITNINGNEITYSQEEGKEFTFTSIKSDDDQSSYSFCVPAKPTVGTISLFDSSNTVGISNKSVGRAAHSEGRQNLSAGDYAHTEGRNNIAVYAAHAEGLNTQALGQKSHTEGMNTVASGEITHAEGNYTKAIGNFSHSEGVSTQAIGHVSHSEGIATKAIGQYTHAEGQETEARGWFSHAEGIQTKSIGDASSATGNKTQAIGIYSASEGNACVSKGTASHSQGIQTKATGNGAFSTGRWTIAQGQSTIASGQGTLAGYDDQTALGHYNKNKTTTLLEIGNGSENEYKVTTDSTPKQGTDYYILDDFNRYEKVFNLTVFEDGVTYYTVSKENRKNAFEVYKNGNAWCAGDVYVGTTSGTNKDDGSKKLATEEYVNSTISSSIVVDSELSDTSENPVQNKVINIALSNKMDKTNPTGTGSFSLNRKADTTVGDYSFAEGYKTTASGYSSHAEGNSTTASGYFSHAEGNYTITSGEISHAEGNSTTASGPDSHAEGDSTTASGYSSHAEGYNTKALGDFSHAEGSNTTASGDSSHAEGNSTNLFSSVVTATNPTKNDIITAWNSKKFSLAKGDSAHVEGIDSLALGDYSHAEGSYTTASGSNSHAEGIYTTASGDYSHAEGLLTTASGDNSHAEGYITTASSNYSHAEGSHTTASGSNSHAEGDITTASGDYSHAEGYNTTASSSYQHVQGKFNIEDTTTYADIIGNGSSNTNRSNAATVDWNGNAWYAGAVTSNGADYAEFFEWLDGNPNNEDRVGYLVALDGEKIRFANPEDEVLGIISANPAILGDNYECNWNGKYLTDEFGRILYDKVEEFIDIPKIDEETGETTVEKKSLGFFDRPRINPDYDPDQEYINRRNRAEWAMVGMLGKLLVRDDGTAQINGYVSAGENGIATASVEKTNIRVLSRVNDHIIKVLLK